MYTLRRALVSKIVDVGAASEHLGRPFRFTFDCELGHTNYHAAAVTGGVHFASERCLQ